MNSLCNAIAIAAPLKPPPPLLLKSPLLTFPKSKLTHHFPPRSRPIRSCSVNHAASSAEIDMVPTKQGLYAPKPKKVVVLWDLDNKPPRGPPYQAAMALKRVAERFGDVVNISAYANRHAFVHLPQWVLEERRERRRLDLLERKGASTPLEPYVCGVCGRKCKTNLDLKKHFRQLHERERQKKLNRMRSLKGKKRQRFKERFVSGNLKYEEAAKGLVTPKVGYGLAAELRRAGVFVKTVEDKPQAADWAVKRQMVHSMSRGIDWLILVSDDSDFSEMLRRAREADLGTVVVGDWDRALGRHADLWVPWVGVENGEVGEEDLVPRRSRRRSEFVAGGEGNVDGVVDELVRMRTNFHDLRISAFSEEGEEEEDWNRVGMRQEGNPRRRAGNSLDDEDYDEDDLDEEDDFLSDSEDEEEEEDDGYY
ncbi:hypothetical protein RJ640_010830 [Escallonia rubra]|uniref:C2H2-type domain-containing protein n=1 Tax=Escallonia rubra TaxID=112253 RepID=A0AA88RPY7_9ASTE|nr:hypothetical protein RJ640_010830 [Escallonia rubra]